MLYLSKKDLYERVERFRRLIGINDSAYPLDIFDLCQNKLSNPQQIFTIYYTINQVHLSIDEIQEIYSLNLFTVNIVQAKK